MYRCLDLKSDQLIDDQRNVKDLFCDWSHMSLDDDVIKQL